jgi:hypothetical protein
MNKRVPTALLTVLAAALAIVLGTTAALAATTWTVRPGGAVTSKSGLVFIKDASTGSLVTCPSSTIEATLKSGTGLPGAGIGSISSFTFATCSGPLNFMYTLTLSHLPYALNATSYNASTGTTTAKITGIHGNFTGPSCSYVLDGTGASMNNGTIVVTYVNGTHKLKFLTTGGNLHVYKLSGCGGLGGIFNNDHITFSGTGSVTPAQAITSP